MPLNQQGQAPKASNASTLQVAVTTDSPDALSLGTTADQAALPDPTNTAASVIALLKQLVLVSDQLRDIATQIRELTRLQRKLIAGHEAFIGHEFPEVE